VLDYITFLVSHEQSMQQGKVETCLQKLSVMQAARHIIMITILQCSLSIRQAIIKMGRMHTSIILLS